MLVCSNIERMEENQDHFEILRKINKNSQYSQRELC